MKTTAHYLDALRARYHIGSDSRLAPLLGVAQMSVSRYRRGEDTFSTATARRVADLLGEDPGLVAAYSLAQRATDPADRELWESLARRLEKHCRH